MKRLLHALAVIALCSALAPLALAKDHGKWHDRDGDRDRHHAYREHREHERDHREWEHRRHEREWREHHEAREHHPPGWDHGRKRGWDRRDVPPGQAKNDPPYHHRHHPPVIAGKTAANEPPVIAGNRAPAQKQPPILAGPNAGPR